MKQNLIKYHIKPNVYDIKMGSDIFLLQTGSQIIHFRECYA